jgi:hypothetical protein
MELARDLAQMDAQELRDLAASLIQMDNSLQMLLPIGGFIGGIFLWSRVAGLLIALSGLTPNPSGTEKDVAPAVKAVRRLVLLLAAAWLTVIGAVLTYMLYTDRIGWALLCGGLLAGPLFTVTNFFVIVRRRQNRASDLDRNNPTYWRRSLGTHGLGAAKLKMDARQSNEELAGADRRGRIAKPAQCSSPGSHPL